MINQVGHNAVTGTDNFRNSAGTVFDQVLRIAQPYIRNVGQTGYLQQIAEFCRFTIHQHLPYKRCTHLRDTEGTSLTHNIFCCDPQSLR